MSLAPSAPPLLQPTLASLGVDDVPEGSVAFKPVYGYTNEQVTHTWHPAARSTHACATLQAGGGGSYSATMKVWEPCCLKP